MDEGEIEVKERKKERKKENAHKKFEWTRHSG